MFIPGKPFHPSLMFAGKARSLPKSEMPDRRSTQVGSGQPERNVESAGRDRHSYSSGPFVSYKEKSFMPLTPYDRTKQYKASRP